jgi:hypothetical protein
MLWLGVLIASCILLSGILVLSAVIVGGRRQIVDNGVQVK